MDLSGKEEPGDDGEPPAEDDRKQPSRPRTESGDNTPFQLPLDEPDKLKAFLTGVVDKYQKQRQATVEAGETHEGERLNFEGEKSGVARMPPPEPPGDSTNALPSYETKMPPSDSTAYSMNRKLRANPMPKSQDPSVESPTQRKRKSPPPRRSRAGAHTSLLRARNIDVNAPDPEEDSPPDETEVERRRRKERINGRRKRAKKLIEIDYLNEQYHSLTESNKKLQGENQTLKDTISKIKTLQQTGIPLSELDATLLR